MAEETPREEMTPGAEQAEALQEPEAPPVHEVPAVIETPSTTSTPTTDDDPPTYAAGMWSGIPQYTCLFCGATTFDLRRMQDHQTQAHDGRMICAPAEEPPLPFGAVPQEEPRHG